MKSSCHSTTAGTRYYSRKVLLGIAAGAVSYLLLLCLRGPWEEILAALLIVSAVGIADHSLPRIIVGSLACGAGWVVGSLLFGVWIELGVGGQLMEKLDPTFNIQNRLHGQLKYADALGLGDSSGTRTAIVES